VTTASETYVIQVFSALTRYTGSKKQEALEHLIESLSALSTFALEKEADCFKMADANKLLHKFKAELEVELSDARDELEHFKKEALAKEDEDVPF
jgi:hypothetical protein